MSRRFDYRTGIKKLNRNELARRIEILLDNVLDHTTFNDDECVDLKKLCYAKNLFLKRYGVKFIKSEN